MTHKKPSWKALPLGPLQSSVMESLWRYGPLSAADMHQRLMKRQDWAYTTIHTELSRLLKKGLVKKHGLNLETRYEALMTRDEYLQATVQQTLADLIGTHGATAIHGFVELIGEDPEALDALRRAVRKQSSKQ